MERSLKLRCPGRKALTLAPGGKLRIGRHSSNDLVLNDATVSRFHCEITWDPDEDRPWIRDLDSANGIEVDGEQVEERQPLVRTHELTVGCFRLIAEVDVSLPEHAAREEDEEGGDPHLVDDSSIVVLFSEKAAAKGGHARSREEVHRVLLDIERDGRTGTLELRVGKDRPKVTFALGKVVAASWGQDEGRVVLARILALDEALHSLAREMSPVDVPLDLSVSALLAHEVDATKTSIRRPTL